MLASWEGEWEEGGHFCLLFREEGGGGEPHVPFPTTFLHFAFIFLPASWKEGGFVSFGMETSLYLPICCL